MRPLARSYLQHGRRHLPFPLGSDPIPGIGELAVAAMRTTSDITVAGDNAQHDLSIRDGFSAHFQTSDDTVFANADDGNGYGIQVLLPGLYRWEWNIFASGGTAGAKLITYWISTGTATLSDFQQGRTGALIGDTWDEGVSPVHLFWTNYVAVTAAGVGSPTATLASGADVHLGIQAFVTRMNSFDFDAI